MSDRDKITRSSKRGDWKTPRWLFDKYNEIYEFTLDAAASAENELCENYFDKETDALKQDWKGKVWCQECGSESEWIGEYVILSEDMDQEDVETDLLRQAHERMRTVAPQDQTTIPEIIPCRACGEIPKIRETKTGRVWIEHKCGENNPFLCLGANKRQAILAWNRKQEQTDEQAEEQ